MRRLRCDQWTIPVAGAAPGHWVSSWSNIVIFTFTGLYSNTFVQIEKIIKGRAILLSFIKKLTDICQIQLSGIEVLEKKYDEFPREGCGIVGSGLQRIQMDIDGLGTMLLASAVTSDQDNGNRDTEVFIPQTV